VAEKRKRGRPKQPVITPEKLREIEELYLRGETGPAIAERLGVHHNTIYGHLDRTIRPAWRELQNRSVEEQIEKIRHLRRTAWRRFDESINPETRETIETALSEETGLVEIVKRALTTISHKADPSWLDIVKWCIAEENKIWGFYAPDRHVFEEQAEFRVAGVSPEELDEIMFKRLEAATRDILKRKQAVARLEGPKDG